jgi:hypothetical protein
MPIDSLKLRALLSEHYSRLDSRKRIAKEVEKGKERSVRSVGELEEYHPKQEQAVNDPAKNIAVLGTRRSGKSRGFLRKLVKIAMTTPDSYQIYTNTSWHECRRIAWRGARAGDGLMGLNKNFNLGATFNKNERTMTFPNGSIIECVPADNIGAIERALGIAPHTVWIDESQKMPHLDYAIKEVLGPAMTDFEGQIILTGTPSIDCSGLFYEVTKEDSTLDGWSVHKLNVLDNPFFGKTRKERYARSILNYCMRHNLSDEDPEVQRMWFGKWVTTDANFVYHVHRVDEESLVYGDYVWAEQPDSNLLGGTPDISAHLQMLPTKPNGESYDWFFGLGTDLGYDPDPFAYALGAWTYDLPHLYEIASWKQVRLIPDVQAQVIANLGERVPLTFMQADAGGGGKGIVAGWAEGWQDRFPIPIDEAKKSQKVTNIEFVNNDVRAGNIKVLRGSPLHEEWKRLTWTPQKGNARRVENVRRDKHGRKRNPNDCSDAWLYMHRQAQHHRYQEAVTGPKYGSSEWFAAEEARIEQDILDDIAEEGRYGGH